MQVLVALPAAELYGSDRVARETVAAFTGAGHEVVVVCPTPGPALDLLRADGVEVRLVPTPVLRREALKPRGLVRLAAETVRAVRPGLRVLREVAPDVVVVNTVTLPLWAVLTRVRRGRRLVVHVHEAEKSLPRAIRRAVFAPLWLAHRVVANSRFTLAVLTASWPRLARRTSVVVNAVPGPPVPPTAAAPHHPARLAYIGRISARKGVDVAVSALARLRAGGTDAELSITGSVFPGQEPYLASLHGQVAALGLDEAVSFAGFTSDVWSVLAGADVVLAPSVLDESFGNSAVEAVLAARPLVASRQGGFVEATAGYASVVIVDPADADALAAGIRTVLADHPTFAAAALDDSRLAAVRHAPSTYATAVVAAALGADDDRP